MENIKGRFMNEIAARLAGAAESDAKAEMIEELADNLCRQYEDMTASGVDQYDAFDRAMEELGNADELVEYLNSLDPIDPLPEGGMDGADMNELLQSLNAVGKAAMKEAAKAMNMAKDFVKKATEQGTVRWNGRVVTHVNFDDRGVAVDIGDEIDGAQDDEGAFSSQGVQAINISNGAGDVHLYVDNDADAPIQVEGDMDKLDIGVTEDGVFTIHPRYTASANFFFARGAAAGDVTVIIPARFWSGISLSTASGDIELDGDLDIGELTVNTASGDFQGEFRSCLQANLHSASGDMETRGRVGTLTAGTASGDVSHEGNVEHAKVKSVSGDVYFEGQSIRQIHVNTTSGDVELTGEMEDVAVGSISGDIRVETAVLPQSMKLSSSSGDVEARIPANGPFSVNLKSTSGDVDYDFPQQWTWPDNGQSGVEPRRYSITSISGDVSLRKY